MARSKSFSSRTARSLNPQSRSLDALLSYRPPPLRLLPVPTPLYSPLPVEAGDRRLFRPDRSTTAPASSKPGASRVIASPFSNRTLRFADPQFVGICSRRATRREVLFAKRKTGKGARARRRRNFWSDISC